MIRWLRWVDATAATELQNACNSWEGLFLTSMDAWKLFCTPHVADGVVFLSRSHTGWRNTRRVAVVVGRRNVGALIALGPGPQAFLVSCWGSAQQQHSYTGEHRQRRPPCATDSVLGAGLARAASAHGNLELNWTVNRATSGSVTLHNKRMPPVCWLAALWLVALPARQGRPREASLVLTGWIGLVVP